MKGPSITLDESCKHLTSDQLIEPMVVPFYSAGSTDPTLIACLPAKQVTGLVECTDSEPPKAIMAMSVGHMGIAAGYTSSTLNRLIASMITMRNNLMEMEAEYAQR